MRSLTSYTVLNAAKSVGIGNIILTKDFQHAVVTIATENQGPLDSYTIKVKGTAMSKAPNFIASKTPTNCWDYIQTTDLNTGSSSSGEDGMTFANENTVKQFELNINALSHITIDVTDYTDADDSGSVTVFITLFSNE